MIKKNKDRNSNEGNRGTKIQKRLKNITRRKWKTKNNSICLDFLDEASFLLSIRIFGLLTSSLLLYSQRFGWYVLRSSSGVSCRTRVSTQNLELKPLFHPHG